jgi:hypothetical protein
MSATEYDKKQDADIKRLLDKVFGGTDPAPSEECGPDPDPSGVHIKEGGWGGDTAGAQTWESVPMKDNPSEFKVIDKAGKNIAHKFASEAEADKYIKYHQCIQERGDIGPNPNPEPGPGPVPVSGETPYPVKGTPMQSTQRGPTTRHYASGKEDDETIEKNVKSILFDDYQWVTYTTMHQVEHDDNISVKFGGVHMGGGGWFDCGISFGTEGSGGMQTCLGTEPKHPSTKLCVVKGPKLPGTVLEKKVGVAGVYHKKENHIELWIDYDSQGWKKVAEGKDVGGLKPNEAKNETQLRIDGFKKGSVPTIHSAIVTEI